MNSLRAVEYFSIIYIEFMRHVIIPDESACVIIPFMFEFVIRKGYVEGASIFPMKNIGHPKNESAICTPWHPSS